ASDAPRERQARELATVLYGVHLAIILYWFHDKTQDARATRELVGSVGEMLRYLRPALRLPPMIRVLSRLAGTLENVGMSGPEPGNTEHTVAG
ncbi:MAG: hypothetical protein ACRDN7_00690, partial [Rubrobacter sp.]